MGILDRVLLGGAHPIRPTGAARRTCSSSPCSAAQAGGTCFCVSMGTGPTARARASTSRSPRCSRTARHYFVVEVGSERGAERARRAAARAGRGAAERGAADAAHARRRRADGPRARHRPTSATLLYRNLEHPRWDDVAERCLTCGNCTMVCPTCFCTTVEDVDRPRRRARSSATSAGTRASRSTTRTSTAAASAAPRRSRYRQWMTHKLATWFDQFGSSGCVGCGRCITWCPVGIDITEEARAIRATDGRADAQRLRTLIAASPMFAGLDGRHLALIAGCGANERFAAGALPVPRGRAGRPLLPDPRRARSRSRSTRPAAGALVIETLHDGDVRRLVVAVRAVSLAVRRARASSPTRRDRVRRRLPARQVRRRPRARLPADAPLRRGRWSSACRRRGSSCSTSMASPVAG